MPDFRCAAVILAAGASSRLGRPKQLVRIEGESLLHRTARLAVEAGCSPVYVVVGFEAERMAGELSALPVETVINLAWQEGMGSSLRRGMEALLRPEPKPDGVLLLVCDQPRLTFEHLNALLARHMSRKAIDNKTITASAYEGRAGVPAIFSAGLFSALSAVSGDQGARELIRTHASAVEGIPWPGGGVDIDRPEDLTTIEP